MKQQLQTGDKNQEDTLFVKTLGKYPLIKVIDFLITFQEFDYSPTDIAEKSDVSYVTLQTFWDKLVLTGIVKKTREVGNATMYKLNKENRIVKKLLELDEVLREEIRKEFI
ncbi:MAG: hypothetical protein R6U26_00280 [Candidatus Undinarchaeales archaeon]